MKPTLMRSKQLTMRSRLCNTFKSVQVSSSFNLCLGSRRAQYNKQNSIAGFCPTSSSENRIPWLVTFLLVFRESI
jgi:hypothetical protein